MSELSLHAEAAAVRDAAARSAARGTPVRSRRAPPCATR